MKGYETHESFWADTKMYINMIRRALLMGMIIQIALLISSVYTNFVNIYSQDGTKMPFAVAIKYTTGIGSIFTGRQSVDAELVPYAKGWPHLEPKYYRSVADYATDGAYANAKENCHWAFIGSFGAYFISLAYIRYFWSSACAQKDEKYIRGAQMSSLETMNKRLAIAARKSPMSRLRIGNTLLPFEMESKHILILGTSGSGKGVLLNQLIAQITERPSGKYIVYDPKGEFIAKQFQHGDYIFNPFDIRSLRWNIFNELEVPPDFDVVAKSLFAPPDSRDSYWYNCAADVFRTGLVYLKIQGTTSNTDLWNFFSQTLSEIQKSFRTLPIGEQGALKHIDKADSPAASSIISILQERIQFFRYLTDMDGDFSFRRFIREENNDNLYILNFEQYANIFRPMMTLAIDTMTREALSLPDDLNRRIFFIIDELGTLNRMDSILHLLTVGRSKGACLFCANQDLGRIEEKYGRANLKTFFNNFNTNFVFRIREPETANFLSQAIGEQQKIKTSQSRQMSPQDIGDRKSMSEQEKTERLIMPTEFQFLQDLHAYINIAGFGVSQIIVPKVFFQERNPPFIMRQFADLSSVPIPTNLESKEKTKFEKLRI